MSYEINYATMMRQREDARSRTPEAIADRFARQRAFKRAQEAVCKRYPKFTADNVDEAIEFQQRCVERFLVEERSATTKGE